MLAGLIAEQVLGLRRVYSGLEFERERNDDLALRLAEAESAKASILSFREGSSIRRVPENDVVQITAADDFCEVILVGRNPLLISGTLKTITASLPDRFLRAHKSHIVNLVHVTGVSPKPGGGHQLALSNGTSLPVGRTYRDVILAALRKEL